MQRKIFILLSIWLTVVGQALSQDHLQERLLKKLSPPLRAPMVPQRVQLLVTDSSAFVSWMAFHHPAIQYSKSNQVFFINKVNEKLLHSLMELDVVAYIDRADRVAVEETVLGNFDFSLNGITASQTLFPDANGGGLVVSIKEKPFDRNDIDLRGRIVESDQFDEPATLHATFMATLAAGAGNTSPYAKGGGWGAGITTSDFSRLLPDNPVQLIDLGVTVQNHSYGVGIENYYGIESSEYDASCIAHPEILHVFSSGNQGLGTETQGTYAGIAGVANLTGQFKVSKNTLTVGSSDRYGNVVPLSSRGPAHDGRVKPELIAFGDAGSSEAAAVVSGIALQVQQTYSNLYGTLPEAAFVKAILINSAADAGRPHVDYETGFGNANALNALRSVADGRFFTDIVTHSSDVTFNVSIPENQHLLKVTLVWADPPAAPLAEHVLVNDLDLTVRHAATNETWHPWVLNANPSAVDLLQPAQRSADRLNNVEQVSVNLPPGGLYEFRIHGFNVSQGPQRFYVVYEFNHGFEWTYPLSGDALPAARTSVLRWNWPAHTEGEGTLAFKYDSEITWTTVQEGIDLTTNYFEWNMPDTAARIQLRMTIDEDGFESIVFPVSKPERMRVGFNCDTEIFLMWNNVPNATAYVVYTLGDQYLETLQTTTDTVVIISKASVSSAFFSVAPVINGSIGLRELTIDYAQQGTGCYFVSVLPRAYFVSEKTILDVTLGTTYAVQSAQLQRLVSGSFQAVSVQPSVLSTSFSLEDDSPQPGMQTYRVVLTLTDGQLVFSDPVEIFYVRESDMYIYPNPVRAGQDINVLTAQEDSCIMELVDSNGKVVIRAEDFGQVKILSTVDLTGSLYILRVYQPDGTVRSGRIVVQK
ncbi:MAG: S8 family serine peptidase [Cyclobacteriaceae bacterium]|nr:S8 family serine peptidase [Cyclobacteriaceae bacterium]